MADLCCSSVQLVVSKYHTFITAFTPHLTPKLSVSSKIDSFLLACVHLATELAVNQSKIVSQSGIIQVFVEDIPV